MKNPIKPKYIPYIALGAGLAGLMLRFWLYGTGLDEKGLLISTHPGAIGSLILALPAILAIFLGSRNLEGNPRYRRLFPSSVISALGNLSGALGIGFTALRELYGGIRIFSIAAFALGLLATVSLTVLGFYRWKDRRPKSWMYGIVCGYFMIHLVCQYRIWSGTAQLQVYLFPMLACVSLMLASYFRAALTARLSSRRNFVLWNQTALFLCLLSIPGSENAPFFALMALLLATDLCSLANPRKNPAPEPQEGV